MEHYLSQKKIFAFKQKLTTKKREYQKLIQSKSKDIMEKVSETGDAADIASEHEKYLSAKRDIARLQSAILNINSVLNDMTDFGYCIECGVEIGEARLSIDPSYRSCVDCAEIIEKKSRLYSK